MLEYSSSENKYYVASLGKKLLQTFYLLRVKNSRTSIASEGNNMSSYRNKKD